jgi:hypothetical protein
MSSESLNFHPTKISHPGWDTLFKALVKKSLGEKAPRWANPSRLAKPWFLSEYETLRKKSISTTPADLKNLNIYVDAASIKRA